MCVYIYVYVHACVYLFVYTFVLTYIGKTCLARIEGTFEPWTAHL